MSRRHDILFCAARQQERSRQAGVKLGYDQHTPFASSIRLVSEPIPIGTADFSLEFFGNSYGSNIGSKHAPFIYASPQVVDLYIGSDIPERGGVYGVLFRSGSNNVLVHFRPADPQVRFHLVVTRSGQTVRVFIDAKLLKTKEQAETVDLGDYQLSLANSSDAALARIYNYALADEEIARLYNEGDPAGYVLPEAMKSGSRRCLAEFLPQHIVATAAGAAAAWLDSARQLPFNNRYLPPLLESIGGYDMTAYNGPEILYKSDSI